MLALRRISVLRTVIAPEAATNGQIGMAAAEISATLSGMPANPPATSLAASIRPAELQSEQLLWEREKLLLLKESEAKLQEQKLEYGLADTYLQLRRTRVWAWTGAFVVVWCLPSVDRLTRDMFKEKTVPIESLDSSSVRARNWM